MPYIKEEAREALTNGAPAETCGELNYVFTRLAQEYVQVKGLSYQTLNDVMGAFIGALGEFQRRIVHPYEERKRVENGDVFDAKLLEAVGPLLRPEAQVGLDLLRRAKQVGARAHQRCHGRVLRAWHPH